MTYWQRRISRPDAPSIAVHSPLLRRDVELTPREYALLTLPALRMGWATPYRRLAQVTGYSVAGVHRAIDTLIRLGLMTRLPFGRSFRFKVNPRIALSSIVRTIERRSNELVVHVSNRVSMVRTLAPMHAILTGMFPWLPAPDDTPRLTA